MSNRDFYFVIVLVVTLVSGIAALCQLSILCPCGTEGKVLNYTQCVDDTSDERSACERWASCETCESNTTYCLTCPLGQSGPTCTEGRTSNCPDPGSIQFGYRRLRNRSPSQSSRTYSAGQSFQYYCNKGYELKGNNVLNCLPSGKWSSNLPKCQSTQTGMPRPYCTLPEINVTGMIMEPILDINDREKMFPPGTEMQFDCEDDYELEGNAWIIYCQLNGEWTAQPPKCIYDSTSEGMPRPYCKLPEINVTGMIMEPILDINDREKMFPTGAEMKFDCEDGYELEGNAWIIYCQLNGEWTAQPPKCIYDSTSEVMCKDPLRIQNGGVIVYYNSRTNFRTRDSDINAIEYPVGTRLSYDCKAGYRLEGEKNLVCRPTGLWSAEKPVCAQDCGLSTLQAGGKITNGNNTKAGEFPWIVFLFMNQTSDTCGGVLLDHRTVLTTAHCLESASYCTLYFGKYNRSDEFDDMEVKTRVSSEIIIHPEFNPLTFDNDIAIVKLSSDVQYSSRIQPICMPSPDSTRINVVPRQVGYVTGWGLDENRRMLSRLMLLNLPVQSPETCMSAYWRRNTFMRITQGMFCAGYPVKKINACEGDSGSPLVFYRLSSSPVQTKRLAVEGLVSHGTSGRCDKPEKYTIFTRVSHYLRWIYENW